MTGALRKKRMNNTNPAGNKMAVITPLYTIICTPILSWITDATMATNNEASPKA